MARQAKATAGKSKGEGDTVALTVRVSKEGWKRLAHLAVNEETSIQALAIEGLSLLLKSRKLKEL
jgi:hypothetical protein